MAKPDWEDGVGMRWQGQHIVFHQPSTRAHDVRSPNARESLIAEPSRRVARARAAQTGELELERVALEDIIDVQRRLRLAAHAAR
eukprot:9481691-Pyramimonas_sp.AAC.1